jgi:hypothetical protein
MRTWFISVAIVGLAIFIFVLAGYFLFGHFALKSSSSNSDWGSFGSYFGGVAGPLLTFLSTLLIVFTIYQQQTQIHETQSESLKLDMLRYLDKIDAEIMHLLSRPILVDQSHYVEFGDLVYGIEYPRSNMPKSFKAALRRLFRLTSHYSESIALYRENVNGYFVFRAHQAKAREFIDYLEKHSSELDPLAGVTLAFCRNHIDGKSSE